jgi:hypothetical protein
MKLSLQITYTCVQNIVILRILIQEENSGFLSYWKRILFYITSPAEPGEFEETDLYEC